MSLFHLQCFTEQMMLFYDSATDDYRNTPGVKTRVSDFSSNSTLRYLDPNLKLVTRYMNTLASVATEGRVRGGT